MGTDPDLGKVRERMVDLEDHHEEHVSVEDVMARLLGYEGDSADVGRAVNAECQRALILMDATYRRMGFKRTPMNVVAIGFLQGITFACAYRDVVADAPEPKPLRPDEARHPFYDGGE